MKFKRTEGIKYLDKYLQNCTYDEQHDAFMDLLDYAEDEQIQNIALRYIKSKDFVIRCDVYELIGNSHNDKYIDLLLRYIDDDRNIIAKSYAVASICSLIEKSKMYDDLYHNIYARYLN